MGIFFEKLEI